MLELSVTWTIVLVIVGVLSVIIGGWMYYLSEDGSKKEKLGRRLFIGGIFLAAGTVLWGELF